MPKVPTITSILTVPGASTTGQDSDRSKPQVIETVQVGIVFDGAQIAWGRCAFSPADEIPNHPTPYRAGESIAAIETIVAPALVGQRLTGFRQLSSILEALTETATIREVISQPDESSPGVSRRDIITGFLAAQEPAGTKTVIEETTIERRLHPAILYGISQALLNAVAMDRRLTLTEVIAEEFELPGPATAVALQMPINRGQTVHLSDRIAALGYKTGGSDPEKSLGPDGERLQRFVRQLRESINTAEQQREITIHLDVGGGLGQLYEGDTGKILGALYGLEQAASPGMLRVQDPLITGDLDVQIKEMKQLRNYLHMRRMSLQLVASAQIYTVDDVRAFVQARAVHMIYLVMPRFGTIQEVILDIQACRENEIGVMLEGKPLEIAVQVALSALPDILVCPPDDAAVIAIGNEMERTLAWLAHKG